MNFGTIAEAFAQIPFYGGGLPVKIGGFVFQRILALAILVVSILWLVISYVPGLQAMMPTLIMPGNGNTLAVLGVVALLIFLAIQLWLVYTTLSTVRSYQSKHNGQPFRLKWGAELFWTALPIAMTIALAWASYALWQGQQIH